MSGSRDPLRIADLICRNSEIWPNWSIALEDAKRMSKLGSHEQKEIAAKLGLEAITVRGTVVACEYMVDAYHYLADQNRSISREEFVKLLRETEGAPEDSREIRLHSGAWFAVTKVAR